MSQLKSKLIGSCALAVGLWAACASIGFAQEVDPDEVIRVNTDLVVLDAQVVDKKTGKPFSTLQKQDFELLEENIRQEIAYFGLFSFDGTKSRGSLRSPRALCCRPLRGLGLL